MKHKHAETMTDIATVVYLLKKDTVCLAQRKQAIHTKDGKELEKSKRVWNGYGGKREEDDASIRDTAVRELFDECGVSAQIHNLIPAARLRFFWPNNTTKVPNMDVYFFFLATWQGEPHETDEMGEPEFFEINDIPYDDMMANDRYFLPKMLANEKVSADVFLGKMDKDGLPVFTLLKEELIV